MALLFRIRTPNGVTKWLSFDATRIVLGRSSGSDLRLPDATVALRHAVIKQENRDYTITDEGTKTGTYVGRQKLSSRASHPLRSGDRIRLGRVLVDVSTESLPFEADTKNAAKSVSYMLVAHALAELGESAAPRVVVTSGPSTGEEFWLNEDDHRYLVGRGDHCDLVIDDKNLSREHVQLTRRGGQVYARDAGSRAHAALGPETLSTARDTLWRREAALEIGGTVLVLDDAVALALDDLDRGEEELLTPEELRAFDEADAQTDAIAAAEAATEAEGEARADVEHDPPASQGPRSSRKARVAAPASSAKLALQSAAPQSTEFATDLDGVTEPILQNASIGTPTSIRARKSQSTEILIALLALAVLALSALGFMWLARQSK